MSDASPADPSVPDHVESSVALPDRVELHYETFGDPDGRPLLLVMGLGGPLTWWPLGLCRRLAEDGFHVIRYDNRDTGRSTRFDRHRVTQGDIVKAFLGGRVMVPYSLRDLANDAFGLLDHLGLEQAHVAGVSMGGMIAQTMAIERPGRVLSLTSIMSSTGGRRVGRVDPSLLPHLIRRVGTTREHYVERSVQFWRRISSPAYPTAEESARTRAEETWDRGISFTGVTRQMVAVLTQRDRTEALGRLRIPATVVHGTADRMVHVSGGRATARAIPGAELVLVPGMGHDLPEGLWGTFVDAIRSSADRADTVSSDR
jgi:pimeloyl-ACP methyl ester carboxylesterase